MSAPEYKQLPHDDDFGKFESPWEGFNKSQKQEPEFKVYLVRHCQSCANVASGIPDQKSGYTKKFWRQPLCTSVGIIQAIAAGIVLKEILPEGCQPLFASSILPRAFTTAKIASVSYDGSYSIDNNLDTIMVNDLDKYTKVQYNLARAKKIVGGRPWRRQKESEKKRLDTIETLSSNIINFKEEELKSDPSMKEIVRIAYIKEAMNYLEKHTLVPKFFKNTGQKQSQNVSSVFNSDTYALAVNNIFGEFGRKVSMHPMFLENITGGDENAPQNCSRGRSCPRRKLVKSSWEDFEEKVLPKLKKFSRSHGQNCVVLFVHGHLLENALNRDKRLVWKKAKDPKKQRKNCSIHCITYGNGNTRNKVETNLQLGKQIPNAAINYYLQMMNAEIVNDSMNKCQYKHSHGNAEIITRATNQIESLLPSAKKSQKEPFEIESKKYNGGHPNPDPIVVNAAAASAYSKYGGKRKRTKKRTRKKRKKRTRKHRQRKKKKTRRKKY
jgi:broad specificity phosphatase PhoE